MKGMTAAFGIRRAVALAVVVWLASAVQGNPHAPTSAPPGTAQRLLLPYARAEGLAYIELTTDADNQPSRRVIEANGGTLVERFHKPIEYGGAESLRFRIVLTDAAT